MKRNMIAIILSMLMVLCAGPFASAAAAPFSDIAGTPYEAAVTQLYNDGIVNGYGNGTFVPGGNITRAEACKILAAAAGIKDPSAYSSQFRDMAGYGWAGGYVGYAVSAGIVKGYPDGTFRPGTMISEDEMLTLLVRALGYQDDMLSGQWPDNYIAKGKELGLLTGTDFSSARFASRGMAALLTYNVFYRYEGIGEPEMLAIVISKTPATGDQPARIEMMDQNGSVRTLKVPVETAESKQLASGDIVGLSVDSSGVLTGFVKMDAAFKASGKFAGTETYAGYELNGDAAIFTFGKAADYEEKTDFTSESKDYGVRETRLMRNASTPAYYVLEEGRIAAMIVPADKGYSGRMYGLICDVAEVVDIDGDRVDAVELLIGSDKLWIPSNGRLDAVPEPAEYSETGSLYELSLWNGVATNIADTAGFGVIKGDRFAELTTAGDFMEITAENDSWVDVDTGSGTERIGIMDDAVFYILDDDGEYKPGSQSSVKEGYGLRAFDVTDDGTDNADVIIVDKRNNIG